MILKRGVRPAEGTWPRTLHGQGGRHVREEHSSASPGCGLFSNPLPSWQPDQSRVWK